METGLAAHASRQALPASSANHGAGSSRHSRTPRGLAVTALATASSATSAMSVRETPPASPAACSPSIVVSRWRTEASAGDLPLDEAPISACHRTSGSAQPGVTCTAAPAPQRPAAAPSTACAT
jgi:hypothetical protein